MIDFDKDLLCGVLESFDVFKTISKPSKIKIFFKKLLRMPTVIDDTNVKPFGFLAIQELDKLGIDVIIVVSAPENIKVVQELVLSIDLLRNIEVCCVPSSFRVDWSVGRGAQYVTSYEDVQTLMNGFSDEVEEYS